MTPRRFALIVGLTAVYFAAGRIGLALAFVNASTTAIWPPTGIAIAVCMLAGSWVWPAVFAGAFLVNITITGAVLSSAAIACGNTAEALMAAFLIRRFGRGLETFNKTTDILVYVGVAIVATSAAATIGLGALALGGLTGTATYPMIWLTWLAGDLASALLVTPVIVIWAAGPRSAWSVGRRAEALLLVGLLLFASYWVYGPSPSGERGYPLIFLTLPVQLWAALRFGPPGASSVLLITAASATAGTLSGLGPFARISSNESLLLLQAYLIVKMVVMLTLAAEVAGRRAVEQDIRHLNADLERRIEARAEDLYRLHGRLVEAQAVAHIGSWEWDVLTNSIWWSDELYRIYGLPVGTPVTFERYISMVHPDDRAFVQEAVGHAGRTGEPFTFEHRAVTPAGDVRTLHSRGRVVTDHNGRLVRMLGIGHDITERRRAEEERIELAREQAARREAEEASRAKDDFLATLSHELRTPVNAIVGWALILRKPELEDALRHRAIEAIYRNVTIQAQLVSDILDVSRMRSGMLSIAPQPTTLRGAVEAAIEMMRSVIADKGILVTVDIPEEAVVIADAHRLKQVCWNMLSNAAKFVAPGGRILVTGVPDGDDVRLTIEDDGPGIPEGFLPHIFEQFSQADQSLTRQHGGLGLGLAIAHTLVRLHGGAIVAANRPEGGAIFTVRLPAASPRASV